MKQLSGMSALWLASRSTHDVGREGHPRLNLFPVCKEIEAEKNLLLRHPLHLSRVMQTWYPRPV